MTTQTEDILIAAPGEPIFNITAFSAKQKASGYVGSHISHLMGGDEPSLLLSQGRLIWRVPILFTTPQQGKLGHVGTLDIDARTGQLLIPPNLNEQLQSHAQTLLDRSTP